MKSIALQGVLIAGLAIALPIAAVRADNEPRARLGESKTLQDSENTLARATEAYKNLTKDHKIPSSVLKNAKCVAIFPDVGSAALVVGGSHGNGVALCKTAAAGWSRPAFMEMTAGSLGLQVGVKSADVVLYLTGDNARSMLESGDFKLSGEMAATAGSFDEGYQAPPNGVISYSTSGGAFAGVSLGASQIKKDDEAQAAFYEGSNPSSIFSGNIPQKMERSVKELQNLLPA